MSYEYRFQLFFEISNVAVAEKMESAMSHKLFIILLITLLLLTSCQDNDSSTDMASSKLTQESGPEQFSALSVPVQLSSLKDDLLLGFSWLYGSKTSEDVDDIERMKLLDMLRNIEVVNNSVREFYDNRADPWDGISSEVHFWIRNDDNTETQMHIALKEDGFLYVELEPNYGFVYSAPNVLQVFNTYFFETYGNPWDDFFRKYENAS